MTPQIDTFHWLQLSSSVRQRMREIFGIPRSEGSFIQDNIVKSDGHTYKDLSVITVGAMQAFLLDTNDNDFHSLFDRVIEVVSAEVSATVRSSESLRFAYKDALKRKLLQLKIEALENKHEDVFNEVIIELYPTNYFYATKENKGNKAGSETTGADVEGSIDTFSSAKVQKRTATQGFAQERTSRRSKSVQ